MRFGGERNFLQDQCTSFEVGERERIHQQLEFRGRKPGKSLQAAQVLEVGETIAFEFIQYCTIRMMSGLYSFGGHKRTEVLPTGQETSSGKNSKNVPANPIDERPRGIPAAKCPLWHATVWRP